MLIFMMHMYSAHCFYAD